MACLTNGSYLPAAMGAAEVIPFAPAAGADWVEFADAAARECSHVLHMDSGGGAFVGLSRWVLAALGAEIPAFRVPFLLCGDRS